MEVQKETPQPKEELRPVGKRCYSCKHLKEMSYNKPCSECVGDHSKWEKA